MTIKQRKQFEHLTDEQWQRELAESADRADLIVAAVGIAGLAILIVVQMLEKLA